MVQLYDAARAREQANQRCERAVHWHVKRSDDTCVTLVGDYFGITIAADEYGRFAVDVETSCGDLMNTKGNQKLTDIRCRPLRVADAFEREILFGMVRATAKGPVRFPGVWWEVAAD